MQIPRKFLISAALALVLLITLLAGLKPKGYRFRNDITWMPHNGISIGPIGIAYSGDSLQWAGQNSRDSGFTIEMALSVKRLRSYGISEILGFWDYASRELLMIGQWKNHLIIRVREIQSRRGYREFGVDTVLGFGKKNLIQIVSVHSTTIIYVNGIRTDELLSAPIMPNAGLRGGLVLGNSATGGEPWFGEFYGIALYKREISSEEAAMRFRQWDSLGRNALPPVTRAAHFFAFNETSSTTAHDCITSGFDLCIPKLFHIIKKQVLIGPWDDFQWTSSYFSDVIINLVGFIPLGFFMSLFLSKVAGIHFWKTNLLLTITICFIISLCIELIQVYLPTRSSQLSDLFLNTLGGGLGALLVNRLFKGYQ